MHTRIKSDRYRRGLCERIARAAIQGSQPGVAVRNALKNMKAEGPFWVCAVGKAAGSMALGAKDVLAHRAFGSLAVSVDGCASGGLETYFQAGHPVPDRRSEAAAAQVREFFAAADKGEILFLLSGGASALLASPPADIGLEAILELTESLLHCGASIGEINTVRRHLDTLKGGKLAALAQVPIRTLAISDVIGDRPEDIGSGLTVGDPTSYGDALDVLRKHSLTVPESVRGYLMDGVAGRIKPNPKNTRPIDSFEIILRNQTALNAAESEAKKLGYEVVFLTSKLQGEAKVRGRHLAALGCEVGNRVCLLSGGETTVTVKGIGQGGRNQELCLAAAKYLAGETHVTLASVGTDGIDGPTEAAGGVVDGTTWEELRSLGGDPDKYLGQNDSYTALSKVNATMSPDRPGRM